MSNEEGKVATELVQRIVTGDKQAENQLVERYSRGLLFILRRKCNQDWALADDIAQDTWRIVIAKIRDKQIKEPAKLSAYIINTGKNLLISHFRKAENKSIKVTLTDADESAQELDSQSVGPEEFLQKYNLALLVKKLVLEMEQPRDKELLFRFFLKEQEKKSICEALNLDNAHFDRVLYRAKQRFRKLWESYLETK